VGYGQKSGATYAVRGIRSFADWVEFDEARIGVFFGPNSSGKSALISAFLLLRGQTDIFRLSFVEGGHGFADFLDAIKDRSPEGRIEFRIGCSVDAAKAMLPSGLPTPDPVRWRFEVSLIYAADPFDGGQSGILVELSLDLVEEELRTRIFSASSRPDGGELSFSTADALALPFVRSRLVGTDEARADPEAGLERAIAIAEGLLSTSRGEATERARRLRDSLAAIRREALIQREFEHIVLAEPEEGKGRADWTRHRTRSRSYLSQELKYLRSLSDMLIAECFEGAGIRSMRSRESGREIRLSFYSVFGEILEAAGFSTANRTRPRYHFPARVDAAAGEGAPRGCATARGAGALVLSASGEYFAWLRDTVNISLCSDESGRHSIEGGGLEASYGRAILAMREAREGEALVPEGREADPHLLDIEARRHSLHAFLSDCGLAEDLEFRPGSSEQSAIMLVRAGERRKIGDSSEGLRRLVVLSVALLYLPWGSLVSIEEPEAGLDSWFREKAAKLIRLLAKAAGAAILVETRSPEFVEALGPFRSPEGTRERGPEAKVVGTRDSEDGLVRVTELG